MPLPVSLFATFQLPPWKRVSCLSSWGPRCAHLVQILAALKILPSKPALDGLLKWGRGPRCCVAKSVWAGRTGCRGCESSGLWAAAQIMVSQKDGTTFESRGINTFFHLPSSHASDKTSIIHKTKQHHGEMGSAQESSRSIADVLGTCRVPDPGVSS